MGENDDGIVLNLTPYVFKTKKPKQINEVHHDGTAHAVNEKKKNTKQGSLDTSNKNHNKHVKRKYIDPKDFVPISNLFNKNPEIPTVSNDPIAEKSQQVLFSTENIDDLIIGEKLKSNLKSQSNFTSLTKIQKLALPQLLSGKDVMIRSPTGSGKTICYAIPVVDKLSKANPVINRVNGPYVLVLVPTRELALQTLGVFQDLCKCCISIVPGMLIGGEKCKAEKARLRKGINILIATPGRLIYHMKETSCLDLSHIEFLILDEADHLLDMGFRETIREIIDMIRAKSNVERQSILLSATLNASVKDLISLSLKDPVFIDSAENDDNFADQDTQDYSTPGSLTQYFIIVPAKLRLISLLLFVISKVIPPKTEKAIVFSSSKNSVVFLSEAFKLAVKSCSLSQDYKSFNLHGDMTQQERFKAFEKFKRCNSGVLFCTDVASRGLDIKKVDWVVHYDCPTNTDDYLHRTGRTARIGETGNSLLFLLPSESKYIQVLNKLAITLREIKLSNVLKFFGAGASTRVVEEKAQHLQNDIEESICDSKELHENAVLAYKSYIQGYATYPKTMKHIFHVKLLHLGHIAKSFGLKKAPVNAIASAQNNKKRKLKHIHRENVKRVKVDDLGEIVCGPRTKKLMHEMKKKKKRSIVVR